MNIVYEDVSGTLVSDYTLQNVMLDKGEFVVVIFSNEAEEIASGLLVALLLNL